MGDDVRRGKIVTEEEIFEAESSDKNQTAGGDARLACALNEKRMPRDNRGNPASECVHRADKRQNKREGTKYIHRDSAYPPA
jgi:hypothetical protein